MMVIVWMPLDVFPQASVAVHVRVIVPVPPQPVSAGVSEYVIIGDGSTSSIAVAVPVSDGSVGVPHSTVTAGGTDSTGWAASISTSVDA